jgi:hypothetical protein
MERKMVEFVNQHGDMRLKVERKVQDKIRHFILLVPEERWADLFRWNAPDTPRKSAQDAYAHDQAFWDWLAERNAYELERKDKAVDATGPRRVRIVESSEWLEAEYARFKGAKEGR